MCFGLHRRVRLSQLDLIDVLEPYRQHVGTEVQPQRLVISLQDRALEHRAAGKLDYIGSAGGPEQGRDQNRSNGTFASEKPSHLRRSSKEGHSRMELVYDGDDELSNIHGGIGLIGLTLASPGHPGATSCPSL